MLFNIPESVSASVKWGKQYVRFSRNLVLFATSFTFSRRETFAFTALSKVGKEKIYTKCFLGNILLIEGVGIRMTNIY